MVDLVIFHYHLLPGGVTNVIHLSVLALLRNKPEISSVTLVCGNRDNTDKLLEKFNREAPELKGKIKIDIIADTGYCDPGSHGPEPAGLKQRLLREYSGKMWLVHNYQLGKNPFFTEALLQIADENPKQNIIFYIHDFPECSRYANLEYLLSHVKSSVYPVSSNTRYAVINERDRKLLVDSGLPSSHVFLVDNPLDIKEQKSGQRNPEQVIDKLRVFHSGKYGSISPGKPLFLYPVRMIRRKNIIEACLISRIFPGGANLVVTLPGFSDQEKAYSDLVQNVFSSGLVSGLCAIGGELDKAGLNYPELFDNSDLILCSSVQEGFGYLFIDSVQHKVPLCARYLDIIDGFSSVFPEQSVFFYNRVPVPCTANEKAQIRSDYLLGIRQAARYLQPEFVNEIEKQLNNMLEEETVDFSYLSTDMQVSFLERIASDSGLLSSIRLLNRELLDRLASLLVTDVPQTDLDGMFGPKTYSASVMKIIDSFGGRETVTAGVASQIQKNLLGCFAKLDYLRLIYNDL